MTSIFNLTINHTFMDYSIALLPHCSMCMGMQQKQACMYLPHRLNG